MSNRVAILDYETRAARDLKKCGVEAYVECEHFKTSCLAWAFDDCDGVDQPVHGWDCLARPDAPTAEALELFEHIDRGGPIVVHNGGFETAVTREMHKRYPCIWPRITREQVVDVMMHARAHGMPAALFDLAAALRLDVKKDDEGYRVMMRLCKPYKPRKHEKHLPGPLFHEAPADLARQLEYCKHDVVVERAAWRLLPPLIPIERATLLLDGAINDRGICVDVDAARHCLALVRAEKARLNDQLFRLTDGYVATSDSVKAFLAWLDAHGFPLPDMRKNTVDIALERPDLPDHVREALMIRQECSRSGVAKLEAALHGVCRDGRMHGLFGFHGAGPGRWVAHRFQPHNMMRSPESFDELDADEVFAWAAL